MGTRRHALTENGAEKSIPRTHEADLGRLVICTWIARSWRNDLVDRPRHERSDVTWERSDPESSRGGNALLRELDLMEFRLPPHRTRRHVAIHPESEARFPGSASANLPNTLKPERSQCEEITWTDRREKLPKGTNRLNTLKSRQFRIYSLWARSIKNLIPAERRNSYRDLDMRCISRDSASS